MADLPQSLGQLQQLQGLDLRSNQLAELPQSLTKLQQLQYLYLSSNQLTQLPAHLGRWGNPIVLQALINEWTNKVNRLTPLDSLQIRHRELAKLYHYQAILAEKKGDAIEASQNYNSEGWFHLISGQFSAAEKAIQAGMKFDDTYLYLYTNLPPSLLLQGKYEKAKAEYLHWKDKSFDPERGLSTFADAFLHDFLEFERLGIIPEKYKEQVEEIKRLLRGGE